MPDPIIINGKKFITSKQAATLTGYARDYIGQLVRMGKVEGKIVERTLFVCEASLEAHKAQKNANAKVLANSFRNTLIAEKKEVAKTTSIATKSNDAFSLIPSLSRVVRNSFTRPQKKLVSKFKKIDPISHTLARISPYADVIGKVSSYAMKHAVGIAFVFALFTASYASVKTPDVFISKIKTSVASIKNFSFSYPVAETAQDTHTASIFDAFNSVAKKVNTNVNNFLGINARTIGADSTTVVILPSKVQVATTTIVREIASTTIVKYITTNTAPITPIVSIDTRQFVLQADFENYKSIQTKQLDHTYDAIGRARDSSSGDSNVTNNYSTTTNITATTSLANLTIENTSTSTIPNLSVSTFTLNGDIITDLTGSGLSLVNGALTADAGSGFSTTSSNAWLVTKTTSDITEGSNLYFTNTRADARVIALLSATTSLPNLTSIGNLTSLTLNGQTVSSLWATTSANYYESLLSRWATTSSDYWLTTKSTSGLSEGSNLYFTDGRADARIIALLSATTSLPNLATLTGLTDIIATRATTTQATSTNLSVTTFGLGGQYITSLLGSNLSIVNGALTATDTSFSSTSADYWDTTKGRWATTSSDYWLTTKSTSGLSEGSNLYFTDGRADARIIALLSATTSLPNLTSVGTLTNLSFTNGSTNSLAVTSLNCTLNTNGGKVTTDSSGNLVCANDQTGGGSGAGTDVNWTYFNGSGISVSTTTNQVVIGASATSSLQKLEVIGGIYITGNVGIGTTSPYERLSVAGNGVFTGSVLSSYFTATSTTATSTFPLLSTNAISINGGYFTSLWSTTTDTLSFNTLLAATSTLNNINNLGGLASIGSTTGTTTVLGGAVFNGNVGIGTTNPVLSKLRIKATTGMTSNLFLEGVSGIIAPTLAFQHQGDTVPLTMAASGGVLAFSGDGNGSNFMITPAYPDSYIKTHPSSAAKLHIMSHDGSSYKDSLVITNGNVGIGTTSPYAPLSVNGQAVALYFTATSTTATSTFPLLSTNAIAINGGYFTSLWSTTTDTLSFNTLLAATTTLNNIVTLKGLTDIIATRATTTNATSTNFYARTIVGDTITATSTTATSTFPNLSLTNLSFNGTYLTSLVGSGLTITNNALTVNSGFAWSTTSADFYINSTTTSIAHGGTGQTSFAQGWLTSNGTTISASTSPTVAYITSTSTATSTFAGSINVTGSGCVAVNDVCIGGSSLTGSGAADKVAYWSGAGSLTYNSGFVWDSANSKLEIPTLNATASSSILQLSGTTILRADTATNNFFAGQNAGNVSATGLYNTGVGQLSLTSLTSGTSNSAFGRGALATNTSGSYNIAIGFNTLSTVDTSDYNTGIGFNSLSSLVTGTNNVSLGRSAGSALTTGSNNTFIGANTDILSDGLSNATAIGYGATVGASNSLILGSGANVGIGTTSPYQKLSVAGNVIADTFIATSTTATSSFPLLSVTALALNGQYVTSFWATTSDTYSFNTLLAATTTLNNLTTLKGLTDIIATRATTTNATSTNFYSSKITASTLNVSNVAAGIGSELVTNGTFTGSATGWTLGANAAYGTNNAVITYAGGDASIRQNIATIAGKTYLVTFTISNANAPVIFETNQDSIQHDHGMFTDGVHTIAFTTDYTGSESISFNTYNPVIGSTWTIDNVSVKETNPITPALSVVGYDGSANLVLGGDLLGNVAIGLSALSNNTTGLQNTAQGTYALNNNTTGLQNTAVGYASLFANTSGNYNTAVGFTTLIKNTTGEFNSVFGVQSMESNTVGSNNAAFGVQALAGNTTGSYNTANGGQALYSNTTGDQNTVSGYSALVSSITGSQNTVSGMYALNYNESATSTVAMGYASGYGDSYYHNQGGVYVGYQAGYSAGNNSDYNTLIGYQSGYGITTGSNNILISTATSSTAIANLTTGSQNILIGSNISLPSATLSGQLNIGNIIFGRGNTNTGSTISTGNIGIGTSTPGQKLSVAGDILGNQFIGSYFTATSTTATSTLPLLSTNAIAINGGYFTSLWSTTTDTLSFNTLLAATSTLNNINNLGGLATIGSSTGTTTFAGAVGIGTTSPASKFVVVGNGASSFMLGDIAVTDYTGLKLSGAEPLTSSNYNIRSGSTDKNLYFNVPTGYQFKWRLNNSEQMTLTAGNFGVGTTTPNAAIEAYDTAALALAVDGGTGGTDIARFYRGGANGGSASPVGIGITAGGNYPHIQFRAGITSNAAGTTYGDIFADPTSATLRISTSSIAVVNNMEAFILKQSTGFIGFASSTPWAQVSINPSVYNAGAPSFVIGSSTKTDFIVTNDGSVGIGSTSPYTKLSVDGRGIFNQDVRADYFTATSTTATSTLPLLSTNAISINGGYFTSLWSTTTDTLSFNTLLAATSTLNNLNTLGGLASIGSTTGTTTFLGGAVFNGKVGVGTTSPDSLFNIKGSYPVLTISDSRNTTYSVGDEMAAINFTSDDTSGPFTAGLTHGKIAIIQENTFGNQQGIAFSTFTNTGTGLLAEAMRINATGYVGIGTTSPYQKLSVAGNVIADTYIATSTTATSTFSGAFSANSSLYVLLNGNVGIGTTSPIAKLQVKGLTLIGATSSAQTTVTSVISSPVSAVFGITPLTWGGTNTDSSYWFAPSAGGNRRMEFVGNAIQERFASTNATAPLGLQSDITGGVSGVAIGTTTNNLSAYGIFTIQATTTSQSKALSVVNSSGFDIFNVNATTGTVGIGTTSPYAPLSVNGQAVALYFTATSTTATSTFPNLSLTNLSFNGTYLTSLVGTGLTITNNALTVNTGFAWSTTSADYYISASSTIAKPGNASYGNLITWNGSQWVSTATSSLAIALSDTTGTLSVTKGGTGQTSFAQGWLSSDGVTLTSSTSPTVAYITATSSATSSFAGPLYIDSVANANGNIKFSAANPYISASSYTIFPGGAYFIGTTYLAASLRARGGITNDTGAVLSITGGTSGYTNFTGNTAVGSTTPWAKFSIAAVNQSLETPFFAIGTSSTALATSTVFIVTGSGNVGIGTTSPYERLSVAGNGVFTGSVLSSYFTATSTTATSTLPLLSTNAISINGGYFTSLWSTTTDTLSFNTLLAATSTLNNINNLGGLASIGSTTGTTTFLGGTIFNGLVGIGTSTPSSKLSVYDSAYSRSFLVDIPNGGTFLKDENGGGWAMNYGYKGSAGTNLGGFGALGSEDALTRYFIGTYSTDEKISILSNGNVGIGTTSPYSVLSVSNNLNTAANTPLFTIASTTAGTATTTAFTVLANGNVGIGSASPGGKLDVYVGLGRYAQFSSTFAALTLKANDNSSMSALKLENAQNGVDYGTNILFNLGYSGSQGVSGTTISAGKLAVLAENSFTSTASTQDSYMQFSTALDGTVAEKMRITSGGNLGIGTTSPYAKLSVVGQTVAEYFTATSTTATSTLPLLSTNAISINGGYFTSLWSTTTDTLSFNTLLAATSTLNNINNLGGLASIGSTTGTTTVLGGFSAASSLYALQSTGYVGVGTAAPAQKLDISAGNLRFSAPAAPSALTSAVGAAGVLTGTYRYRVSYVTATGETELGTLQSASVTPSAQQVDLTAIPVSSDSTVTARKIYRNKTADGVFAAMYLVTTISDNTTTTYTDNIADGSLGALGLAVPTSGGVIYLNSFVMANSNSYTTSFGRNALGSNKGPSNSAFGLSALANNTTGGFNNAFGSGAGSSMTTGTGNNFFGASAGSSLVSGSANSAFGNNSLTANTAANNSAFGSGSGQGNTSGSLNVYLGYSAGTNNQTGSSNTIVGASAGVGVASNSYSNNSLFGYKTGNALTTGSNNILLGYQAGDAITTGTKNIIIGYDIDATSTTATNSLNIGNLLYGTGLDGSGTTNSTGNIGIGTTSPYARLSVMGSVVADSYNATSTTATSTISGFLDVLGTGTNATSTFSANLWVKGNLRANVSYVGDLVFANNFRFLEAATSSVTQYLYLQNQTGSNLITFDQSGNVGIGTTTPAYKLQVNGDVAANSFVNISTASAKRDIAYLSDDDKMDALTKLNTIKIARYHYKSEDPSNPLRLGLIAEEAPSEILSVGGKGVDIYKLATFTLAAVQAQQKQIDTIDIRLSDIEAKVAANVLASSSPSVASVISSIKELALEKLTIGSTAKPSGITLYDEVTGAPYCLSMANGSMKSISGECGNATQTNTLPPVVTATTTPTVVEPTASSTLPVIPPVVEATTTPVVVPVVVEPVTPPPAPVVETPVVTPASVAEPVAVEPSTSTP